MHAAVNEVSEGSPARISGLLPGDKIIRFGDVSASDGDRLRAVSKVVQVRSHDCVIFFESPYAH